MGLEARVDALERDVASLRAETRLWAAFATSADQKTIAVGDSPRTSIRMATTSRPR